MTNWEQAIVATDRTEMALAVSAGTKHCLETVFYRTLPGERPGPLFFAK
jgi:hypothetical protein